MHLARRTRVALALAIALVAGGAGTAAVAASEGTSLGARPVFLVRSDNTVDASVAGAAAARAGAPLLYTDPGSLEMSTRDYLTSYQPTKVVLVGGTASLSTTVEASITTLGFPSVRLAGANRSETATMLANLVAKLPAAKGEKGDSGPAGTPGPAGAGAPRLVDHTSRVLGTYLGNGGVLTPTGYEVGLSLHNDRVEYRPRLYFQAAGCTGTPYDDVYVSNYLPNRTNSVEWSSYFGGYVSRTYMAPNTFVAQSELTFDANSGTYTCGPSSYAVKGVTFDVFTPATVGLPLTISYPLTIQQ